VCFTVCSEGNPIGEGVKGDLKTLKSVDELTREKQRAIAEGRHVPPPPDPNAEGGTCGNCYGAGDAGQCCNTCDDVRNAYKRKGWQFDPQTVEQCTREGFGGDATAQVAANEGCNIYGHLEMPKVAGNFHFAPGAGLEHAYAHVHDLVSFTLGAFNITHRVNALSFGVYYPGGPKGIMDGLERSLVAGTGMHQYFLKLVPTVYQPLHGEEVHSFQFSVTEHLRKMAVSALNNENNRGTLPGVFFNYDLSPLRVRIEEKRRSFGHFLTRVFAIIGGVFTVMGLLDGVLHKTLERVAKKGAKGVLGK
jgi:hypothetical protein